MGLLSSARSSLNAAVPGLPLGDILLGNIGDFKRGFVFEVIDTNPPPITGALAGVRKVLGGGSDALMTKSLVLNPVRYTLSEPFAVTLTPTEDNTVIAEENGQIIREIVIEGTTGLEKRKEEALGRGGSIGTKASGVNHFYQLRDVFRKYSDLKKDPERAPYIHMVFHNVKEDDHFIVVPRSFETPRDAKSNRMHFNYRITLAAIQELPLPKPPGLFDELAKVGQTLKDINEAVTDIRANLVEAIDLIEVYRGRVADPLGFLENVARSTNDAWDFAMNVVTTVRVGAEFFDATEDLAEDVQEALENDIDRRPTDEELGLARKTQGIRQGLEKIHLHPEIFEPPLGNDPADPYLKDKNLTQDDLDNNTGGASTGSRTRLAGGSVRNAGLNLGQFTSSRRTGVGATDTIDTLAAQHGVPREAIIELNNLKYPFITRGGGPGTLKPGDDILIPSRNTAGGQLGVLPNDRYLTADDILYGVDLALDKKLAEQGVFDIVVDEVHGSLDAELIRGKDNAVQGVQIIIGTERGTTDFIPDLGIKRTPGIKGTVQNMLLASLYLREAILDDPRITGIDSSRIVLEGDTLTQEITPELIDGRGGSTIVVPFGKASQ